MCTVIQTPCFVCAVMHNVTELCPLPAPGHYGQEEHGDRHPILDGPRGDPRDRLQLRGRHLVAGYYLHRDGRGEASLRRHSSHESKSRQHAVASSFQCSEADPCMLQMGCALQQRN